MDEAKNLTELLALLKKEIIEFLKIPRERGWGQIVLEKGLIKFNLKKDAFRVPSFEEILDDAWITTS